MEIIFPQIKVVISGAAVSSPCREDIYELSYEVGKELAKKNCVVLTGATTGVPLWVAKGAFENGALVVGISPARSYREHTKLYKLPVDYHNLILYSGEGYSGRNLLLVKMGDGAIFLCGRTGTLNEFSAAFEEEKPIAVLTGSGGVEKYFSELIMVSQKGEGKIIWESDPKILVEKFVSLLREEINNA
ncbi:MAG: LOG family protein [Patescibacteria group bacterium]|nr:LOG family protein [Patescibacteria group bacterium]